ncbi:hypothetical protein Ahy_A03g010670 [Arachis hypogaea]|uniref:Uncharacterized protein n=1 Tax=Arachis hypogaea TaxID=3818 RepID=A0A445DN44_ARAHY|nr:hypothetical protein Ahy_A03g010670 [Arachis hypogaea]
MGLFSQAFVLHFPLLITLLLHNHVVGVSSTTDKQTLITLKSQLSDDTSNKLSSWNQNTSPCSNWTGVKCNKLSQRVTSLDLSGLGLSGQLSSSIGNLIRLRVLNMSSNNIEGVIPSNITLLTQLQILDLSSNKIVSSIPTDIGSLRNLQVLKLGKNNLHGAIPASLGNISSLRNISLGTNYLSGWIPSDLGRLKNLIELDLTINNLTGTVPPVIYNITSLVNLALAANSFWGELPQDVGHTLPNLLVFNFCFNRFTGGIPASLHNLTNIRVIRMAHNLLEGTVPPGLGNLPFLRMYNIGYNKIVSSQGRGLDYIIHSLTNSTKLNFLAIDGNRLEGVIPEAIGNLSKNLSILYMGGNRINGSIPSSIGHLSGMRLLNLSYNLITGEIPQELGQLEDLQELILAGNQLSGTIPKSLGNLLNLNQIDLSRNEVVGTIPSNFGNFQSLLFMDLSSNKLSGSIPGEILNLQTLSKVLNLSMNLLSGPIPQVGNLISVATIDFSINKLYEYGWGEKPSSAGDVYSFGIVLLELFSGKSPTDECFAGGLSLTRWVQSAYKVKKLEVIDPRLISLISDDDHDPAEGPNPQLYCLDGILGVGLSCAADTPDARIGIREALRQLKSVRDSFLKNNDSKNAAATSKRYYQVSTE